MNFKINCTDEFGVKCAKIQHCVSAGRLANRRQKGALDPSTVFSGKGCCLRCQSQFTWCVICIVAHEAHWALLVHPWLLRLLGSNEDTKAKSYVILIIGSQKEPWRSFQKLHQFKTFVLATLSFACSPLATEAVKFKWGHQSQILRHFNCRLSTRALEIFSKITSIQNILS